MVKADFRSWGTHPFADVFPTMNPDEYAKLKEDIRTNGVREPVTIMEHDGNVYLVDGRHRRQAVMDIEDDGEAISLPFAEISSPTQSQLVSFVLSLNVHRRHMTPSVRAAMAVELDEMLHSRQISPASLGVKEGITRDVAGTVMGVNSAYVQTAKAIKESHPDLFEQLHQGTMSLQSVKREIADRIGKIEDERTASATVIRLSHPFGDDAPKYAAVFTSHNLSVLAEDVKGASIIVQFHNTSPKTGWIEIDPRSHLFAILQGEGSAESSSVQNGWTLAEVLFRVPPKRFISNVCPTTDAFLRTLAMDGESALIYNLPTHYAEILSDAGMNAYHCEETD